jgi:cytochrome c oxidase subunit II
MRMIAIVSIGVVAAIVITAASGAQAPQPSHEVNVVAKNYSFEPATIQVVAGEPVRLLIRSADGIHGFSIPKLRIDLRIPKGGDLMVAEFVAPSAGRYEVACSEFCGSGHRQMKAALVSVAPTTTHR